MILLSWGFGRRACPVSVFEGYLVLAGGSGYGQIRCQCISGAGVLEDRGSRPRSLVDRRGWYDLVPVPVSIMLPSIV